MPFFFLARLLQHRLPNLRYNNATSSASIYDVCSWACSPVAVGSSPSNGTARVRDSCRERCRADGVESFLCRVILLLGGYVLHDARKLWNAAAHALNHYQRSAFSRTDSHLLFTECTHWSSSQRYCLFFPDDPACPAPDCRTYDSIERDPEYCDQTACVKYLPSTGTVVSTYEQRLQRSVCKVACSRQRLGDVDNKDTSVMRSHCKHLCEVQGPATSQLYVSTVMAALCISCGDPKGILCDPNR